MRKNTIAIDASPNTRREDIFLAFRLLISPWKWHRSYYRLKLESYFTEKYGGTLTFAANSGRLALMLLLSVAIEKEDEVLVQAFTCLAVPNAVHWAGGNNVFVDIDKKTYNINPGDLRKKITSRSKVVIIQHTFGIPAALDEIKKICDEHKLILIEDCAHALGAKYKDQLLGTYGDAAIFSFNQDKVVSGVSGGILIIKNKKLAQLFAEKKYVPQSPSTREILRILLHPILWAFIIPLYEKLSIGKALTFIAWQFGVFKNTISKNEEVGTRPQDMMKTISDPQATLVLTGLKRLEKDNERRIRIADRYRRALSGLPIVHPDITSGLQPIYLRYPLQVEDPKKLFHNARKEGIILGKWYDTPIFPWTAVALKYYTPGGCPTAEAVGKTIVNLPTFPRLTDKDVTRIIEVVKQTYEK